ncbi:baseplate J/gp47 family protein [Pandoraea apista]|uniref:Baseplate protein n=1 Tax=Pandoraea apista TaxID=93218 RepID=A0A5E5P282_9BURK|nr:baseplate J/gp47 family protein [Pandoraea apista]AVF41496.1 baseplate protein [Pandoraea apista]OXS89542.1 baseplate protein [Pandoraea apista]VVG70708.1 baseplate protein [Pandoraea apista]
MTISTKDFVTLVREQVTAIQGGASALVDLTIGSTLRAVVEATASVALWLQSLILQLLVVTRAATSSGADLDTWMADFGVTRIPAVAASGFVTYARFTPALPALVPVGATPQTRDGTQTFIVTVDATNPAYDPAQNAYMLPAGTMSVTVPVLAQAPGAAGNVVAGAVNTITQGMPGIDTVSNGAAFLNGADAELDAALRTRFIAYINSLSKATRAAVLYAVLSLQQNVSATITENQQRSGLSQPGFFYVIVDDGTGAPSSTLLASAANAIEEVRPLTVTYGVYAPNTVIANVAMVITTAVGYDHSATTALVKAAIQNYINSLGLGTSLSYTRLAQLAYAASDGVTNVTGVTLNGGASDLAATSQQTIKAGTVQVT